eukprot:TRINITY_DN11148_c0_g1_i2.p1 TRINITY_DN11148_c0_g1~~TRINITY_DN11148_c0_g1_i2.p1  ORF type:complete len:150 (-),score=12.25 TRINITY_DN11148_c0_g1_i2:60-509(-)
MKERPYTIISVAMGISIIVFGISLKMLEQPYMFVSALDWEYIWNGMWCMIVLMTTVGYGDFYPRTHFGRIICFIGCIWGQFLVSLMVVALTYSVQFQRTEPIAYSTLKRIEQEDLNRLYAVKSIQSAWRLYNHLRKAPQTMTELSLIHI